MKINTFLGQHDRFSTSFNEVNCVWNIVFIAMYYLTRKTSLNIRFRWENTFISTYNSYCCTYDYDFSVITIKTVPDIILYIGYSNCLDSMKSWFCKKEQSAKENKQNQLLILHYKNPPKYNSRIFQILFWRLSPNSRCKNNSKNGIYLRYRS